MTDTNRPRWIKVAVKSNVASEEQGAFMTQILKAALDIGLTGPQVHRVRLTDGSFEFFLESPWAELIEKTQFKGVQADKPPREAELKTL